MQLSSPRRSCPRRMLSVRFARGKRVTPGTRAVGLGVLATPAGTALRNAARTKSGVQGSLMELLEAGNAGHGGGRPAGARRVRVSGIHDDTRDARQRQEQSPVWTPGLSRLSWL